ncbi:unnamed protein product [Blepharisma stoltei]|uniref:Uncharacterized protein n=1 Tax=Blepharisma stoltei TaxID=1481888 RepID=A0AAU9K6S9_9CILI|nr:unnamed protein product [Blepharisma stoltei]
METFPRHRFTDRYPLFCILLLWGLALYGISIPAKTLENLKVGTWTLAYSEGIWKAHDFKFSCCGSKEDIAISQCQGRQKQLTLEPLRLKHHFQAFLAN